MIAVHATMHRPIGQREERDISDKQGRGAIAPKLKEDRLHTLSETRLQAGSQVFLLEVATNEH